jgi:hypothetical protein
MNFKRLVGAEHGWGGALGTLLLLGAGLLILLLSVADLTEASRLKPEERGCAAWLADSSGARWVTLVGCKLDVPKAASRTSGKTTEFFIPIFAGEAAPDPAHAVLATVEKDPPEGKPLTGYVETVDGQLVLKQGKQPPRGNTLLGLVMGLIAVALAVRSMFLRYLVDRDSAL